MVKIEEKEAYLYLTDIDMKVIEQETYDLYHSSQRNKREMIRQYYMDSKNIWLIVYWDSREVAKYRFDKN